MALAMNVFPRLTLLALGEVPMLVALLATHTTLVIVVPTLSPCFRTSGLGTLGFVVLCQQHLPAIWSPQQPQT